MLLCSIMRVWAWLLVAALVSGVAFAVSLPPLSFAGLGWVVMVPVLWAARGQGFMKGFLGGLAAGLAGAWVSVSPLLGPEAVSEGLWQWNIVGFGLYAVVLSLICGGFAEVKEPKLWHAFPLAGMAVLVELLTFIKMPAHLALTQFANPAALALASVTGIWGVSFVLWAGQFALATALGSRDGWRVGAGVAVCGVLSQTVFFRLPEMDTSLVMAYPGESYGVVQTARFGADELFEVQAPLVMVQPRLAVWPELSTSSFDTEAIEGFTRLEHGWPVVTTYLDDHEPKPHNAAVVIDESGVLEAYHKRKPFGEEAKDVTAGNKPVTVAVKSLNVGLNICFDSCFPWVMRDTVRSGNADMIALPTLDPPSPNGFIQAVHAAFTPFRAAELGVPIVRAEATAWSMVVDSRGEILRLTPIGWEGAVNEVVPGGTRETIYRRFGDWFLVVCGVVCLVPVVARRPHNRRSVVTG